MSDQLDLAIDVRPAPKFPPGMIVRAAEIDREVNCRWTLRRSWGSGPSSLWCGANPSTADGERDDPTMLREIGFSYRWGFGSLVKVNIFPYIASDPKKLRAWLAKHYHHDLVLANALRIKAEARKPSVVCVAAWGAILKPKEIESVLWDVYYAGDGVTELEWKCLGLTASGAPKHTLARGRSRVPDDAALIDYPFEFNDAF